jgi:prepilin-type N-terminal cleavage/methylation domain-containing protein
VRPTAAVAKRRVLLQPAERRTSRDGLTLIELLVVIAVIGILIMLLLPAIQAAREAARRTQCLHHLSQLILAVQNYQSAFDVYPPGTQAQQGPIQHHAFGYHHSWITQILPYIEQKNAYDAIDWTVGVYHPNNQPVRWLQIATLNCPSAASSQAAFSSYAGVHHDVEAPIDADNHGVFFLNRLLDPDDVTDGVGHTLFLGEKIVEPGDLGWMSGTNATLRNTGVPINVSGRVGDNWNWNRAYPADPFGDNPGEDGFFYGEYSMLLDEDGQLVPLEEETGDVRSEEREGGPDDQSSDSDAPGGVDEPANVPPGPVLPVGGFASVHASGSQFAFGDGRVQFLAESIAAKVYRQLGHRADGQLLNAGDY